MSWGNKVLDSLCVIIYENITKIFVDDVTFYDKLLKRVKLQTQADAFPLYPKVTELRSDIYILFQNFAMLNVSINTSSQYFSCLLKNALCLPATKLKQYWKKKKKEKNKTKQNQTKKTGDFNPHLDN